LDFPCSDFQKVIENKALRVLVAGEEFDLFFKECDVDEVKILT